MNEEEIIFLKSQVELYKTMYLEQVKYGTKVTLEGEGIKEVIKRMRKDYIPVKKIEEKIKEVKKIGQERFLYGHKETPSESYKYKYTEINLNEYAITETCRVLQQLIKENTEGEE